MPASSIDPAALSEALDLICQAEAITPDQVEAVRLLDDEIEVKVAHPSGHSRLLVYPLAALRGWPSGGAPSDDVPANAVPETAPSGR